MTPVKHLALNLGAPGDRKDADGLLWLGYPRPRGSLVLQYQVGLSFFPGWSYFKHDPARLEIEDTDKPWVFRSGVSGLRQCKIPVAEAGGRESRYTVRLAFAELDHDAAGKRVFDIKIQGKVVAKGFDVFQQAGGKNRPVVKEFTGIDADDELTVEFVPKAAKPTPDQLPILQGIEVQREQVLTLGLAVPSFLLNNAEARTDGRSGDREQQGRGFRRHASRRCPGRFHRHAGRNAVEHRARTTDDGDAAGGCRQERQGRQVPAGGQAARPDGTIESQQEATLEYLGDRRRVVLKAVEDAHVVQSSPTTNYGTNSGLNVDGGDRKMGDHHHGITYLKFRIQLDGTPVSATTAALQRRQSLGQFRADSPGHRALDAKRASPTTRARSWATLSRRSALSRRTRSSSFLWISHSKASRN